MPISTTLRRTLHTFLSQRPIIYTSFYAEHNKGHLLTGNVNILKGKRMHSLKGTARGADFSPDQPYTTFVKKQHNSSDNVTH